MRSRKILPNTARTKRYLDSLPVMYLVGCWAHYGTRSYPFSGEFALENGQYIPLVYVYDDHNGEADQWELRKITRATAGIPIIWTQSRSIASKIAELYQDDFGE